MMQNTTLHETIEKSKFDLAIVDGFPAVRWAYMVSWIVSQVTQGPIQTWGHICQKSDPFWDE